MILNFYILWLLATLSPNATVADYDWNILILIILIINFTLLLVFSLIWLKVKDDFFFCYQYSFVHLNLKFLLLWLKQSSLGTHPVSSWIDLWPCIKSYYSFWNLMNKASNTAPLEGQTDSPFPKNTRAACWYPPRYFSCTAPSQISV